MMRWHDRSQSQTHGAARPGTGHPSTDEVIEHDRNPAARQPGYPVREDRDPLRPGPPLRTDRRRGSPGPHEPLPAAPRAGRPGAGQASSPRRKGTGRGLTASRADPSTTTTPRSVNPAGRGHAQGGQPAAAPPGRPSARTAPRRRHPPRSRASVPTIKGKPPFDNDRPLLTTTISRHADSSKTLSPTSPPRSGHRREEAAQDNARFST